MFNDRPLQDPRTQEALAKILAIYREYDLAGGCYVVNEQEMGFAYATFTTWNAVVEDESTPLGFRIRAKQAELGPERARALLEGTAHMVGAMRDFGQQCSLWGKDLMQILRRAGISITYTPFGGQRLPRLGGVDMRER